jgi:hypothetical protein
MCPSAPFMKTAPGPPKHEKQCVNISLPGCTGMHYVIGIFHRMQKHKSDVMSPDALFMETGLVPPEHEK